MVVMQIDRYHSPIAFARLLRKNLTQEERIMWELLRNRRFRGYKFVRQHPIKVWETDGYYHYYIADFYCAQRRLVLEIDGLIHCLQEDYDRARDVIMMEMNLKVLRVKNQEVNRKLNLVLQKIAEALDSSPDPFSTV
jgi:very-short-patch-repair endonuclease